MNGRMMDTIMGEAETRFARMLDDFERQWEGDRWREPIGQNGMIPGTQSQSGMGSMQPPSQELMGALQSLMQGQQSAYRE